MDEKWLQVVESSINEGLHKASQRLQRRKHIRINAEVHAIASQGKRQTRVQVTKELSVGILAPFSGRASGLLAFLLPWSGAQRFWAETMGSAPLTTHDVTCEHLVALIEVANEWCQGYCDEGLTPSNLEAHSDGSSVAIDMPMTILQTLAIESARRKMTVCPLGLKVRIADNQIEGQAFVAMRESRFKQMRTAKEVAA